MNNRTRIIDCFFFQITISDATPKKAKPTKIVPPRRPMFFTDALCDVARELKIK